MMGRQEETAENDDYTSDFDDLDAEYKQEEQAVSWTSQLISTCKSTIKTMGQLKTNIVYNAKNSTYSIPMVQRKEIELQGDNIRCILLGKQYSADTEHRFLYVYRNTFWFTYRKDIEELNQDTDNGWGCMIRAVQMVLAEALKRHFRLKQDQSSHFRLIKYFNETTNGVLSLINICTKGNIYRRWTSSLEVFAIVQRILQEHHDTFNLHLVVFGHAIIYDDLRKQALSSYPAMIVLANRVGLKQIPSQLFPHYYYLMNHPKYIGSVGGIGGQALYLIGHCYNKIIFLDPHYVQSNQQALTTRTYFNDVPRGIEIDELSPSVSFCYYFESFEDHMEWIEWATRSVQIFYPNLVFEIASNELKEKLKKETLDMEDIYQVL